MKFGTRVAFVTALALLASFGALLAFMVQDLRNNTQARQSADLRTVGLTLRSTLDRNANTALSIANIFALQRAMSLRWQRATGTRSWSA